MRICARRKARSSRTRRNGPADPLHGMQGVDRLVFLESRSAPGGKWPRCAPLLDVALDDPGDGAPGPVVHPVGQFEIAHGKLGLVDMVVEGVEFGFIEPMVLRQLGVEPGDGIEPLPLKGVVQGLPEIEILQLFRSGLTRPAAEERRNHQIVNNASNRNMDYHPLKVMAWAARDIPRSWGPHPCDLEALRLRKSAPPGLADDGDLQIMLAGADIAGIDALHPPLLQGFELLEGVEVMGDRLAVQLDLDRIETEGFPGARDTNTATWVLEG
jgi:hypothetical protein